MTDELVTRLHWHHNFIGSNPWSDGYPFLREVRDRLGDAAARIEQLTAQLAEDADARALVDARIEQLVARVDALTAERDEAINQLDSAIHSQIVLEKRTAAVMEDRRLILEERDRTFALMLARAEKAEAERDQWIAHAKNAVWTDSEELKLAEADNARLREALEQIAQWSEAYPTEVFPEPDFARAAAALASSGMSIDAVSASNMRHATKGVGKIARAALKGKAK